MRDDRERLRHILDAIDRIDKYAVKGYDSFVADELIQNWMIRHLQVIGEAGRATSKSFREGNSDIPWAKIIGMRHVIVHEYFGIDTDIVWQVVSKDLPELKRKIERVLEEQ